MNWYAVHTRPHCEFKAQAYYCGLGLDSYVPSVPKKGIARARKTSDRRPVVSGYVFVAMDTLDFEQVNLNPHTKSIVRRFGMPAVIQAQEIELMQQYLGDRKFALSAEGNLIATDFAPGQTVRVQSGVLQGKTGSIIEVRNGNLHLFLEALQIHVVVSLEHQEVVAA
jgi:transcription antitermination factor NusG